ncbi:MAG TPA: PQQ-dependent sugar dehydrogenase, partial [Actinomycetota bacterium]
MVGVFLAALMITTGSANAAVKVVQVAPLTNPVGFTFAPNGRIVYAERDSGEIRFLNPRTGVDRLFFRIGGVNSEGERGTLGVALHPDWPRRPFVYVYVTRGPGSAPLRNQLVRIRSVDGHGRDLRVLLQSPIGGRTNHNGGRIAFGPDGKLYVVIGDGGEDPSTAQDLSDEPRGKVLRLNPDGSIPATNPFGA